MSQDREPAPGSSTGPVSDGLAGQARRTDPDRFLAALFAPAPARAALFALIGFNHELVRAAELPSARSGAGPIASLIRLQWWREVVSNQRGDWRNHPVATAIRALVESGAVRPGTLDAMLAAREAEAEGLATLADWRAALRNGPGGLQRATGEVLGVPAEAGARLAAIGAAHAVAALHRRLPFVLGSGRCPLPDEMLQEAGTDRAAVAANGDAVPALRRALAGEGARFVAEAAGDALPRSQRAAVLPLVLARRDLEREDRSRGDAAADPARGLGDRLAVVLAAIRP